MSRELNRKERMDSTLHSGVFSPSSILIGLPFLMALWAIPGAIAGVIVGAIAGNISQFVIGGIIVGAASGLGTSVGTNTAAYVASYRGTTYPWGIGGLCAIAFGIVALLVLILR